MGQIFISRSFTPVTASMKVTSFLLLFILVAMTESAPLRLRKTKTNRYDKKEYIPAKKFNTPNLKGKKGKLAGGVIIGGNTATVIALGAELIKEKLEKLPEHLKKPIEPVVNSILNVFKDLGETIDVVDRENDTELGNSNLLWLLTFLANFFLTNFGPKLYNTMCARRKANSQRTTVNS